MNMRKTTVCSGLAVVLGSVGMTAQAAMLMNGDLLTITAGVSSSGHYGSWVSGGSYFACDCNGNLVISIDEMFPIAPGSDGGIVVGTTQMPGQIDDYWNFFTIPGRHYTTVPVTGGTTNGVDLSGWTMDWNGGSIELPSDAWTPTNCATWGIACSGYADGVAVFSWSGVYGDAYTLDYSARVPQGHPSGFDSVPFFLHLEGVVVSAVPVPAAVWLLGSGLLGLMGAAGREQFRR